MKAVVAALMGLMCLVSVFGAQCGGVANGMNLTLAINASSNIFGPDIKTLQVSVVYETDNRLHVKIFDPNNARYEVPSQAFKRPAEPTSAPSNQNYQFTYTTEPFTFTVTRVSDGQVVFQSDSTLIFEDQFLEISNVMNNSDPNIYGFGERIHDYRLTTTNGWKYTMWAVDNGNAVDQNLYGVHPYYMQVTDGGKAHGVLLLNSNGMDVVFYTPKAGETTMTYRPIGGVLDFYFFMGNSPILVTEQYHQFIGPTAMPPYWSLGFHLCRYGYTGIQEVETVHQNFMSNKIPIDTFWVDIDYMDQYMDFTWDPTNWPESQVSSFVDTLHSTGYKWITMTDPGIHNVGGYTPYSDGVSQDIFIKDSNGSIFIGKVWPGSTAFPDFLNPKTQSYWQSQFQTFFSGVDSDGVWIDMNEISNFCNGNCEIEKIQKVSNDRFDPNNPPYAINNFGGNAPLDTKTIPMDATHVNGLLEYNVHSLFGHMEAIHTRQTLENLKNNRSFVIGRSTFVGSGAHEGHWLGDNESTFASLQQSLPGALNMGMFGISMTGPDICGFNGNTNMELCTRWMEVGAFYPFSRNHNTKGATDQFPYDWPQTMQATKTAFGARYALLPYYYYLFYQANSHGGAVMQPLLYTFPQDPVTYKIDQQFMIGSGLLVSPVVTSGVTSVSAYFPSPSRWFDWWTGAEETASGWTTLQAPLEYINVHVRGGSILPLRPLNTSLSTTQQERNNEPYQLLVAVDSTQYAMGGFYMDNGEDLNVGKNAIHTQYQYTNGVLTTNVMKNTYSSNKYFNKITYFGLASEPISITANGKSWSSYAWDSSNKVLNVTNLSYGIGTKFSVALKF